MSIYDAPVNPQDSVIQLPPKMQWKRGEQGEEEPLLQSGCWELPLASFEGLVPQDAKKIEFPHLDWKTEQMRYETGYGYARLNFCILTTVERWFAKDGRCWFVVLENGQRTYYFRRDGEPVSSNYQIYALVKELDLMPVVISLNGTKTDHVKNAIETTLKRQIIGEANKLVRDKNPAHPGFATYHFWLPLEASQPIKKGGSYITPPIPPVKLEINTKTIETLYVGSDVVKVAQAQMQNAAHWAAMLRDPKSFAKDETEEPGEDLPAYVETTETDSAPKVEEDEFPF